MGASYLPHWRLVVETLEEASFDLVGSKTSAELVWIVIEKIAVVADFADVVDSVVDFVAVVEAFVVHVFVGLWSYWPSSGLRNLASFGYDALEGQSFLEIVMVGI